MMASHSVFKDLLLEGQLCDAVIMVEDFKFPVHKVILSNCTPYFRDLFTCLSKPDQKLFNLAGLSPSMMQLIIEFAYTGSVTVTKNNAQELLVAAKQLSVMEVVQTCSDFLNEVLNPQNCIGIFHFTKTFHLPELHLKAFRYIINHFEEVVSCEEFLQLSVEELCDILERDELNVRQEVTVYEAILRWITPVPQEREGYITVLFSKVRLTLMRIEYITTNVLSNELIRRNFKCFSMICKALKDRDLTRPRLPSAILFAIGGWSGRGPTNCIEAYDVRANQWTNLTNPSEYPRAFPGAAFLGGYIYCVGGSDRKERFNSVRRFNLSTRTWAEVAPMYFRRCYVSVTVLKGCIYAIGGYDGHARLNTGEFYCPENNQWHLIAPMHEQRSDASCTTFNNKVYICGGFNGNECLQTAESYDPQTNQWTIIAPMSRLRSGLGVIAYGDHIYAVGGFNGVDRLFTAEAYNPQTNTWHNVSSMMTPRSNFGIEVIEDCLFVVGGYNGVTTTSDVEFYNNQTNEWSEACDMKISRSAVSCCVVSGLSNMSEYSAPRGARPVSVEEVEAESGDSN